MKTLELSEANKNIYVRFLVNLLADKYHVNLTAMAKDADVIPSKLIAFRNGNKNFRMAKLIIIENYIIDLYGPLLNDELEMHSNLISELKITE